MCLCCTEACWSYVHPRHPHRHYFRDFGFSRYEMHIAASVAPYRVPHQSHAPPPEWAPERALPEVPFPFFYTQEMYAAHAGAVPPYRAPGGRVVQAGRSTVCRKKNTPLGLTHHRHLPVFGVHRAVANVGTLRKGI